MNADTATEDLNRDRTTTLAANGLGLAPVILLAGFLGAGEAGYESVLFVWTHVGVLLSTGVAAVGVTTLLYGHGARRLGLDGLLGAGFAWLAIAISALWTIIAWEAVVLAQSGSSSLGTFTALFSPMGDGFFAVTTLVFALAVTGIAIGLGRAGLTHRVVAGVGAAVGGLTALVMLYALGMAVPTTFDYLPLGLATWVVLLPLAVGLGRHRGATATDAEGTASA